MNTNIPLQAASLEPMMLLMLGYSNPQIAERIPMASGTVRSHVFQLFKRFKLSSRAQLSVLSHEKNWFSDDMYIDRFGEVPDHKKVGNFLKQYNVEDLESILAQAQLKTVYHLARGYTFEETASLMEKTPGTVRGTRNRIYSRLGLSDKARKSSASRLLIRLGYLSRWWDKIPDNIEFHPNIKRLMEEDISITFHGRYKSEIVHENPKSKIEIPLEELIHTNYHIGFQKRLDGHQVNVVHMYRPQVIFLPYGRSNVLEENIVKYAPGGANAYWMADPPLMWFYHDKKSIAVIQYLEIEDKK